MNEHVFCARLAHRGLTSRFDYRKLAKPPPRFRQSLRVIELSW